MFHSMINSVEEEQHHDVARAHVKIREMTNRLMGDMVRKCDREFGVGKGCGEAASWFHKAAKAGSKSAQYNLEGLYVNGWWVEKDRGRARYWLRKAADQGMEKAQRALDKLNR